MVSESQERDIFDLFVVGGGVNGCGIARDAAGRGLSVCLAEMDDLASATSSASSKLFHGGLRYLEYFEFKLVREALSEREVLLRSMPHISWPKRFVIPYHEAMRFEASTPTSRLLSTVMPWMKGKRPAWLIRLGLFLYDNLGRREILPGTATLNLKKDPAGAPLQDRFEKGFEYSDCWVEDARLVTLNARDAAERGCRVMTRAKVVAARVEGGIWQIEVESDNPQFAGTYHAKALVNAGGPWVEDIIRDKAAVETSEGIRLVRGSHIVVPRLFDHDKCYFLQGTDGRIIFAIPYEHDFTLIGTTDQDHDDDPARAQCSEQEKQYLCDFISQYFKKPVKVEDIVWSYSGVRPLYNDGASSATAATREYVLSLNETAGAPMLNVFGGKITTYRTLSENALLKLQGFFPQMGAAWTADSHLPGGAFPVDGFETEVEKLLARFNFLDDKWARRLVRAYGNDAFVMLEGAKSKADLGTDFGATLTEREVLWQIEREFARDADDIVWRRSKLGLRMRDEEIENLQNWLDQCSVARTGEIAA